MFSKLLEEGWRGLYVTTDPYYAAQAVSAFGAYGGRAVAMCAAVTITDDRLVAGENNLMLAGIHPQAFYPFWTEPNPPMPEPRIAVVKLPVNSFRTFDILTQWTKIDAVQLTVADVAEAQLAGSWLSAGWKVLGTVETPTPTVWAVRAV